MKAKCFFVAVAGLLMSSSIRSQGVQAPFDVVVQGGRIVDGSLAEPFTGNVYIRGDRIVRISPAGPIEGTASRIINATGLIVSPGFVDPHSHTLEDLSDNARKSNLAYLMQGVTTVVTGNDGGGPVNVSQTFERWRSQGIGTNAALFVGHGSVRESVVGQAAVAPSPVQMDRMKAILGEALDSGAIGMSTGLYYAPGNFATTEEVIQLAKIVAEKNGVYDSHMRDESSYTIGLLGSVQETIRIGREAGIPVNISHIKCLGTDVWGKSTEVIGLIQRARAEGVRVTADQYPYVASGSSVTSSLVPRWAEDGGRDALLKRIADPDTRARLVKDMEDNLRRRGGPDSLLMTSSRDRSIVGKRLGELARQSGKSPVEAAIDIIKNGGSSVASFNMTESDIENFMRQEWVMTGSDGSTGHPRKFGTYPRKFKEYVFGKKVLSLPAAVRASSSLVAETFRIPERGRLAPGYFADVIAFDPQTMADRSTYEQPEVLAAGMRYVLVNGKVAVDDGKYTGVLAGQPAKKR